MKLNELIENYGNYEVKEGFLNFLQKPRPKTVWDLQIGDTYYFFDDKGKIYKTRWYDESIDNERRANHRCYLTEQDAEFAREQEKIIAEMERLGGTRNMMSLGDIYTSKYGLRLSPKTKELSIISYDYHHISNIHFASEAQVLKAIKAIGVDRIKKYLFYVED